MISSNFRLLSDQKLIRDLKHQVRTERSITLRIVHLLIEVERRKLYLTLGYSSMHDYASRGLGYSDSAAFRRIRTARSIALYPEIEGMIDRGELSFCAVAKISNSLTPENKNELLRRVTGKRLREIDAILAEDKPAVRIRDKVKPIGTIEPPNSLTRSDDLFMSKPNRPVSDRRNGGQEVTTPRKMQRPIDNPKESDDRSNQRELRYKIEFSAGEDFIKELAEVQALLSNGTAGQSYEQLFRKVMGEYLERHDPAKKQERREKRKERAERGAGSGAAEPLPDNPVVCQEMSGAQRQEHRSRQIPSHLRDEIALRDGHRCTFMAPDGTRCDATRHLQIDHITPFALGGEHKPSNLRLLCGPHNRLEAERMGLAPPEREVL